MSRYSVRIVDTSCGDNVELKGDFNSLCQYTPREGEYITIEDIEYKIGSVSHKITTEGRSSEQLHIITINVWRCYL